MNLTSMRQEYLSKGLHRNDLDPNPIKQFEVWFNQALQAELLEPNAMTLATVGLDFMPSLRTVLLKMYTKKGFVFFSNYKSKKAQQLQENPKCAALFTWLPLERQVKIEGICEKISTQESLKYFLSRPKGSQIGAYISHQSQIISSRTLLEAKFNEIKTKFLQGEIPFPSFWGGYLIKPQLIEFWQGGENRLHDRFEYRLLDNNQWEINRLEP